jgi:hypothetical protein
MRVEMVYRTQNTDYDTVGIFPSSNHFGNVASTNVAVANEFVVKQVLYISELSQNYKCLNVKVSQNLTSINRSPGHGPPSLQSPEEKGSKNKLKLGPKIYVLHCTFYTRGSKIMP